MAQLVLWEAQGSKVPQVPQVQLARQATLEFQGPLAVKVKMDRRVVLVPVVPQVRPVALVLMVLRVRPDSPVPMEPPVLLGRKVLMDLRDQLVKKVRTEPLDILVLQVQLGLMVKPVKTGQPVLSVRRATMGIQAPTGLLVRMVPPVRLDLQDHKDHKGPMVPKDLVVLLVLLEPLVGKGPQALLDLKVPQVTRESKVGPVQKDPQGTTGRLV